MSQFLGLRGLRRRPMATLTISLVVGLTTAIVVALVSFVDTLYLQQPSIREPQKVVVIRAVLSRVLMLPPVEINTLSVAFAETPILSERAGVSFSEVFDAAAGAEGLRAVSVTRDFFQLAGQPAALGSFGEEQRAPLPREIVLGDEVWKARFGGDPSVIGRLVELPGATNDAQFRVAGVMPAGFTFPRQTNLWIIDRPRAAAALTRMPYYGRLADGQSVEALRSAFPLLEITTATDDGRPTGAAVVLVMGGLCFVVSLVAWTGLLGFAARQVFSSQSNAWLAFALGASQRRIALELLETALSPWLISAAAGLGGSIAIATWLRSLWPMPSAISGAVVISPLAWTTGAIVLVLALAILVLLALGQVARVAKLTSGALGPRRSKQRWHVSLVLQLALASGLLYVAGTIAHSLILAADRSIGFTPQHLFAIRLPSSKASPQASSEEREALDDLRVSRSLDAIARVRSLPGVKSASLGSTWPLRFSGVTSVPIFSALDQTQGSVAAQAIDVGDGFFEAIGSSFQQGLAPKPSAHNADEGQVVVSRSLANHLARFGPVLGQRISITPRRRFEVVGVVEDIPPYARTTALHHVFFALPEGAVGGLMLIRLAPEREQETLRAVVATFEQLWPGVTIAPVSVATDIALAAAPERALGLVAVTAGGICVLMCAIAVWSSVSDVLVRDRRALAIRLALGARRKDSLKWAWRSIVIPSLSASIAGATVSLALFRVYAGATGWNMPIMWQWVVFAMVFPITIVAVVGSIPIMRLHASKDSTHLLVMLSERRT